jgi:predicted transcriptional regulator of viral defense system
MRLLKLKLLGGRREEEAKAKRLEEENAKLKEELKDIRVEIARAGEEKGRVEGELHAARRLAREARLRAAKLEARIDLLEERLEKCLQRREPKKLARMARIVKLGLEVKHFTPAYTSKTLGMKRTMINDYLAELVKAGVLKRIRRGYYGVSEGIGKEDIEVEIARRLAQPKVGEGP